jgi:hypothetical protein
LVVLGGKFSFILRRQLAVSGYKKAAVEKKAGISPQMRTRSFNGKCAIWVNPNKPGNTSR